jgi:hypothetical protein
MYPIDKLLNYLYKLDEVSILELLDLSTEDILDRFRDKVIERRAYLQKEVEIIDPEEQELFLEDDYIDDNDESE